MTKINESLKSACQEAIVAIDKTKADEFLEIKSKLEYVIGSYEYDKNPVGLHEIGKIAYNDLISFKESNPKKVTKKALETISKAITKFEAQN